jgi:hypothetical protein
VYVRSRIVGYCQICKCIAIKTYVFVTCP